MNQIPESTYDYKRDICKIYQLVDIILSYLYRSTITRNSISNKQTMYKNRLWNQNDISISIVIKIVVNSIDANNNVTNVP
jgi:hypothetical protein